MRLFQAISLFLRRNLRVSYVFTAFLLMLLTATVATANDGIYFARGSQLVPVRDSEISIDKEVLTITLGDDGYALVDVQYQFLNHGAARTVKVGFEASAPYNTEDSITADARHPHIHGFTVEMNGNCLPYTNAVVYPDSLEKPFEGYDDDRPDPDYPFSYAYLFDAPFREGLNTVHHTYRYRVSYGVGRTFEVPYWLTPAMRWKGGCIGDFTLRIRAEQTAKHFILADTLFRGSQFVVKEGRGKVRHTRYRYSPTVVEIALRDGMVEWHKKNFVPSDDIAIQSADIYTSFDEKYPVGYFYDRSDNFTVWPREREVPQRLSRNLPYANRGYVFRDKDLQRLFKRFWWYMPDPAYVPSTADFTPRERRFAGLPDREEGIKNVCGTIEQATTPSAPAAVREAMTPLDSRFERVLGSEGDTVGVWSMLRSGNDTSSEGYGVVVGRGTTMTPLPDIRHGNQPRACYDGVSGSLWLAGADTEGTGILQERLYLLRFSADGTASVAASLAPFDVQEALLPRLEYVARGNDITLYADGLPLTTVKSHVDDMGAFYDDAVWIGEQIAYDLSNPQEITLRLTPGISFVVGRVLIYDDMPTLVAGVKLTESGFAIGDIRLER